MTESVAAETVGSLSNVVYILGLDEADARRRHGVWQTVTDESAAVMMRSGLAGSLENVRTRGSHRRFVEGYKIFRCAGDGDSLVVEEIAQ